MLLTELGYPGDDPTVAPADGWEWQEDEDPPVLAQSGRPAAEWCRC